VCNAELPPVDVNPQCLTQKELDSQIPLIGAGASGKRVAIMGAIVLMVSNSVMLWGWLNTRKQTVDEEDQVV
jgi:hypothetical protein